MLTHEQYEKHAEAATEIALVASELRPTLETWGLYSYGDAPGGIGGGVGGFLWFSTREELLDFVAHNLTYFAPGPGYADHDDVAEKVAGIVIQLRAGAIDDNKAIALLNARLKRFSQIEWWGTLSDLCRSGDEFPRAVRAWSRGEDSDSSAVQSDELDEFLPSIETYGV